MNYCPCTCTPVSTIAEIGVYLFCGFVVLCFVYPFFAKRPPETKWSAIQEERKLYELKQAA